MLTAYLPDEAIILCRVEVGSKQNEIAATPRLLKSIDLKGKVLTGDAMFAQRELSRWVIEARGGYIFRVKDNQASLRSEIESLFEIEEGRTRLKAMKKDLMVAEMTDKEDSRLEQRRITTSSMLCGKIDRLELGQELKIEREIEEVSTGKRRNERDYEITSLRSEEASARKLLKIVRKQWMIGKGLR